MKKLLLAVIFAAIAIAQSGLAQVPTQEQLQTEDAQLNQVYQQLRGTLSADQKQQLKLAQREWIKQRDAFVAANPGNPQGALYKSTMQRVAELSGILGKAQQDNVASTTTSQQSDHQTVTQEQCQQADTLLSQLIQKTTISGYPTITVNENNTKNDSKELIDRLNSFYSRLIVLFDGEIKNILMSNQQKWENEINKKLLENNKNDTSVKQLINQRINILKSFLLTKTSQLSIQSAITLSDIINKTDALVEYLGKDEKQKAIASFKEWEKTNSVREKENMDIFSKYNFQKLKLKEYSDKRDEININISIQKNKYNKDKDEKNNDFIAYQDMHLIQNEIQKKQNLNIIYLSHKGLIVTSSSSSDIYSSEIRIWDCITGRCLRKINIEKSINWIFPSSDDDSFIVITSINKYENAEWYRFSIETGKMLEHVNNIADSHNKYGNSVKWGVSDDCFWYVEWPLIFARDSNGLSKCEGVKNPLEDDDKISIGVGATRDIEPQVFDIRCRDFKNSLESNDISYNDIKGVILLDVGKCLIIYGSQKIPLFCSKHGELHRISESELINHLQVKGLSVPQEMYSVDAADFNNDLGITTDRKIKEIKSVMSSDPLHPVIPELLSNVISVTIPTSNHKKIEVATLEAQKNEPIQVSLSNKSEKILVASRHTIRGINLSSAKSIFTISNNNKGYYNNPLLSANGTKFLYTIIPIFETTNNNLKEKQPFSLEQEGSYENHNDLKGSIFLAYLDKPLEASLTATNSVQQGLNKSKNICSLCSSNNISILDISSSRKDTITNFNIPLGSLSFVMPTSTNSFEINTLNKIERYANQKYQTERILDTNISVDAMTTVSDFDLSPNGSALYLENSKFLSDVSICKANTSPFKINEQSITSTRWINSDRLFITSRTEVSILSSDGRYLSTWRMPNGKGVPFFGKWSGANRWDFDLASKTFAFASPEGCVRLIHLNDDSTFEDKLKIFFTSIGEPIYATEDNYYATHSPRTSTIAFTKGVHSYPLEQFDLRLNRPDIVLERLGAPKEAIETAKSLRDKRLKRMGVTEEMLKPDFHLPELQIVGEVPASISKDQLDLQIKATDDKYPLDRLRVYVNNVPVNGRDGELLRDQKTQNLEKTIPIKLAVGRNKIQVSVLNSAGAESLYANAEVNCPADRPKPNLYAVALGVSQYDRPEWCLKYAAKDATDLIGKLKAKASSSYSEVKPLLLTDKEVTKESAAKIKEFLSGATIDDTVLIFMAGHGLLDDKYDYYFGTTDIDPTKPSERGMPYEAIDNILAEVPSLKKALLMDTCPAGELDDDEKKELAASDGAATPSAIPASDTNSSPMAGKVAMRAIGTRGMSVKGIAGAKGKSDWYEKLQDMFVDLRRGSGATVISSSQGAEYAFESSEQSNGLFTYSLMEALDGKATPNKDGQITISSVGDYVKKRVQDLTKGKQNPNLRGVNLEEDFTLSSAK